MKYVARLAMTSAVLCSILITVARFCRSATASNIQPSGTDSLDYSLRNTLTEPTRKFNGKLVFSSDRHNTGLSIWTMNPDGSSPMRLTDEKSRDSQRASFVHIYDVKPAWSPDGTKIAFVSNRGGGEFIYTMNADGTNFQLLTDKLLEFTVLPPNYLAWSPDGKKIAFAVSQFPDGPVSASSDIYVINSDGSGLTKLITDSGQNFGFTWSPDGKQIAFASTRDPDGRPRIWVMNSDGGNQRRLTDIHDTKNPTFYSDMTPSWSPDGTKILFIGSRDFNGTRNCYVANCSEIFVMNADGSDDHAITNDPNRGGPYQTPKWSPDISKIVTSLALGTIADRANGLSERHAIIVMNNDGSNQINLSNRSDRSFFDESVDWQPLSAPSTEPSSSVLSFSAPSFSAYEDSGRIPIIVKRTGNLNATASCYYSTADGTATVKSSYAPVFGNLRFASGEASKAISVPLTDNAGVQGDRYFKIRLFDNEGNATFIGGIREATVTVLDKDSTPRTKKPIDDTYYFVRQHYVDFLNREPDPEGLAYWINQVESCRDDAPCRERQRINVSAAFYLSIEFQEIGSFVYRFTLLNPDPNYGGFLGIERGMQEIGGGVVVGQPGWEEQLQANRVAFVQRSYDDNRLVLSYGRADEEWIDLLFQYVSMYTGITLPETKRDALVRGLTAGTETRPTAFIKVLDDEQFKAALFNPIFVLMQYYGYLRRDPDDDGYNFWLNKLNAFNGDYQAAEMVKAFISSSEYRQRFGPTVNPQSPNRPTSYASRTRATCDRESALKCRESPRCARDFHHNCPTRAGCVRAPVALR